MRIGFISDLSEKEFQFAADHDIHCVERILVSGRIEERLRADQLDEIQKHMSRYDVDLSMIALFGPDYISPDPEIQENAAKEAKTVIDFCAELGAPVMATGAGGEYDDRDLEIKCQIGLEVLPPLVEYAKSKGVQLAIYNCHWGNFLNCHAAWEAVLPQIPDLRIKYDPSHPVYEGRNHLKELRDWGHKVCHVHAKDVLVVDGKGFEDPPAGMGSINWGNVMALLYHHNYDGDINDVSA